MDDDTGIEDTTQEGIGRRTLIKRAAIGMAAVWAAPALLSESPANAATGGGGKCLQTALAAGATHACITCPACENQCGTFPGGNCCCFLDFHGCCFCGRNQTCTDIVCTKNTDCPPGYRCAYTCCDPALQCVQLCGSVHGAPATGRTGGRMQGTG